MRNVKLTLDNSTTPDMFDNEMVNLFSRKTDVILDIDASRCTSLRFKTIMKLLPILDKHRDNSHKYLKHTSIVVPNKFISKVINFSLPFIRTEQPVYVSTLSKL
jgi:hypothetical protein